MRLPIGVPTIVWLAALGLLVAVAGLAAWRARGPVWGLLAIGAGCELIYLLVFTGAYPLPVFFPRATNFGQVEGLSRTAFGGYVLAQALLFAGAAAAVWLTGRTQPRAARRVLFGGAALFGVTLLPLYPYTAIDVFYYVIISRVWGLHGANPFLVAPSAFPDDSYLHLAEQWVNAPSLYGPVWILISLPAAWLAAQDFLAAVYFFKVLGLITHLGCGWLVERLVRPAGEKAALRAAAFWLWNPLVLHEGIGEAHNDLVLTGLLLLALYLAARWPTLAAGSLAAATLLKVTVLPLLPLALRSEIWRSQEALPSGKLATAGNLARLLGVVLIAWIAAYLPFWAGRETFAFLERLDFFAQSIPALAILWFNEWRLMPEPEPVVKYGSLLLYGLIYLWLLARPGRTVGELAGRWFEALFWYFVVAVAYYHNWYLIPLIGCAAVAGSAWQRARAWTIALSGQIGLATSYFVWHWFGWGYLEAYSFTVPVYFAPALLVTSLAFAYHVGRRKDPDAGPPTDRARVRLPLASTARD